MPSLPEARPPEEEEGYLHWETPHWGKGSPLESLATVAALKEKIERLSQSITRGWPDGHTYSQSHDHHRRRSWGWSRRCCTVRPEESRALPSEYSPTWWGPGSGEDEEARLPFLDFDLRPLPELGPEVNQFLQELACSTGKDDRNSSFPEPPVEEYKRWVTWWAQVHDMPDWWLELAEISEVDNHWMLAWKIWASFELPWQITKQHGVENYHQAPPALLCLHQKNFLPQQDLKFPCWDIRESQLEKMVMYTQALQSWAEKVNLPTLGQPHLLVGSVLELREVMKCYISFPDNVIFSSVALPEGSLTDQPETTIPRSTQPASTNSPIEEVAAEEVTLAEKAITEEAAPIGRPLEGPSTSQILREGPTRREHLPIWFPGWREVLHPSRPVTATRQVPPIPQQSRQRPCSKSFGGRRAQHQWAEEQLQVQITRSEPTSPIGLLKTAWQVTPPLGFWEVMSCLQRDLLLVGAHKAPPRPLAVGSSGGVYCGNDECQLYHEGWGHWDNLHWHHHHFCGVSGPQGCKPWNPDHGATIKDITNLP